MPNDMPKGNNSNIQESLLPEDLAEELYVQIKVEECSEQEVKNLTSKLRRKVSTDIFFKTASELYKMLIADNNEKSSQYAEYLKLLYGTGSRASYFDKDAIKNDLSKEDEEDQIRKIDYCVGDIFAFQGKPVKIKRIYGEQVEVADADRVDLSSRNINELLERAENLLLNIEKSISTTPSLAIMYQVVSMEFDYLRVRLEIDIDMLRKGTAFSFGDKEWVVDYKGWSEKLRNALSKNSLRFDLKTDDVCYHEPAFDYKKIVENRVNIWHNFHENVEEVIFLLDRMNECLVMPSKEKILNIYEMLYNGYQLRQMKKDCEEYKVFMIGVPKCNLQRALDEKRMALESELEQSGFFDGFGSDSVSACQMLYDQEKNEWDKESLGRHIFGHKKTLTNEKVYSFFRYVTVMDMIRKDYPAKGKNLASETLPTVAVPSDGVTTIPGKRELTELLKSIPSSNGNVQITLNYVNGDQVMHKDANIDKNFGTIITND